MKKHTKIVSANKYKIDEHPTELQRVLKAIAKAMDEPGMAEAFVTDESTVGDFTMSVFAGKLVHDGSADQKVSEELGIAVTGKDYLWQVAERLAVGKS